MLDLPGLYYAVQVYLEQASIVEACYDPSFPAKDQFQLHHHRLWCYEVDIKLEPKDGNPTPLCTPYRI